MNDKIIVKEDFELPSGVQFRKNEMFYGQWNCVNSIDKQIKMPNLVIICNQFRGPYLLQKENFTLITNEIDEEIFDRKYKVKVTLI